MGLESGTYVDDLVTSNPVGATDDVNKGDDHLRLIKSVLKTTFPNATKAFRFETVLTKTGAYPVVVADARALILADVSSGAFTITLPLGSSVFAGFSVIIMKSDSSANAVTVDGNGAETINGAATRSLASQYQSEKYVWEGTEWKVIAINSITNDSITFAKMQNITTARLLGRTTAASGDTEEIAVDATLDLSGLSLGVAAGGVDTTELASSAVETAKINALAITGPKIAANAVDGTKIALGSDAEGDVMYYDGTDWVRLAKGSDGEVQTLVSGLPAWAAVGAGSGLIAVTPFTASSSWTPDASATSALIFCTGGGGPGGSRSSSGFDAGGGAGATAIAFVADTTAISSETVTIGAGGTAESTGGTSSVGSLASAAGGTSGGGSLGGGGDGGAATVGDVLISGGDGSDRMGGASFWGGGAKGIDTSGAADGIAAKVYGTGGSGASATGSNRDGGAGKAGIVLILEW